MDAPGVLFVREKSSSDLQSAQESETIRHAAASDYNVVWRLYSTPHCNKAIHLSNEQFQTYHLENPTLSTRTQPGKPIKATNNIVTRSAERELTLSAHSLGSPVVTAITFGALNLSFVDTLPDFNNYNMV
uniref:Uncharacterized protein n=1 Tax=Schistocephalus solidus TaxID=70667 RepID=A0A0X3Q0G4_SCHSO